MAEGGVKNGRENGRFAPGSNGGHHGKPGRSGRKTHEFIAECEGCTDDLVMPKVRAYLAKRNPGDEGWRWAATFVSKYAKGLPTQTVEHTGKDGGPIEYLQTAKSEFEGRINRVVARLGSAGMPEGIE